MAGRGRGEAPNLHRIEDDPAPRSSGPSSSSSSDTPAGTSSSGDTAERPVRGRGGYRTAELNTIPAGVKVVQAECEASSRQCDVVANFVKITPMKTHDIYKYRIDFEPSIDSVRLRREMIRSHFGAQLETFTFDGYSEIRSTKQHSTPLVKSVENPGDPEGAKIKITVKNVGKVDWSSFEMLRTYNMNARKMLETLGFYPISINAQRAHIHHNLITTVGGGQDVQLCGGFRTAVNLHMGDNILMNLESVHKVMQTITILQMIVKIKERVRGNFTEAVKRELTNKLVVTEYKKNVYKIEDIAFNESPETYFFTPDKEQGQINLVQYFQRKHSVQVKDVKQPLLVCVQHGYRTRDGEEPRVVRLVPELCKMAGMTEDQISRMRREMITATQVPPATRVMQMQQLLNQLQDHEQVKTMLRSWGYSIDNKPVKVPARQLAPESIQLGSVANNREVASWPKVDQNASFDGALIRDRLVKRPAFAKMAILVPKSVSAQEQLIMSTMRAGFEKIGLRADHVDVVRMFNGETAGHYVSYLRDLNPDTTAAIVILPLQNKEKYDAIKKHASVDRGMITQVVTARLITDPRKANGASVKIGIQVAAKIGGEPWYINFPLKNVMVCGYDTYHDTVNRLVSFGAFVGSLNDKCSQWYSRVDRHDQINELSSHLTENLIVGLRKYKTLNGNFPERLFIYRDGVGDGQIEHVHNSEVQQIKRAIREIGVEVRLTFIIVNKRVGARFYLQNRNGPAYINCQPGTVIDGVVTRKERFDFYLISQSTRAGTVAPTYYNIINDESGLTPARHQAMAYKFCFLYYNWAGSVRVPAPCQYAHKLALLCGEHLHSPPNSSLEDRLHFL